MVATAVCSTESVVYTNCSGVLPWPSIPGEGRTVAESRVCADDELSSGEMQAFYIEETEVLVARDKDGTLHAVDGICPHEDFPLVYGLFDGTTVTCANHMWCFDVTSGRGINAPGSRLNRYPIEVRDGGIYVDPSVELPAPPKL